MPKCTYKGKLNKADKRILDSVDNIYLNLEITAKELTSVEHMYRLISYCCESIISGTNNKTFSTDDDNYTGFEMAATVSVNSAYGQRSPYLYSDEVDFHRAIASNLNNYGTYKNKYTYNVTLNLVINDLTDQNCTKDVMWVIGLLYYKKTLDVTYKYKFLNFPIKVSNIIVNQANLKYFEVLPAHVPNAKNKITFSKCNIDKLYLHSQFNEVIFKDTTAIVYSDIFVNKESYVRKLDAAQPDKRNCIYSILTSSSAGENLSDIAEYSKGVVKFREYDIFVPASFSCSLNIKLELSQILFVNVLHNLCKIFSKNYSLKNVREYDDNDSTLCFGDSEDVLYDVLYIPRGYIKGYCPCYPTEDTTPLFSNTYQLINNSVDNFNKEQT